MTTWDLIYTAVVGMMLLAGLWSLIYTIDKVPSYRKPVYWLAIGVEVSLVLCFVAALARIVVSSIPRGTIVGALEIALFLMAIMFITVPYVDRLEAKRLHPENV
jgi:hypothetical protein